MVNGINGVAARAVRQSKTTRAKLDFSTVELQHEYPETDQPRKRLFGLEEAPTYRPTLEEFKDPLQYVEQIAPHGKKYGIVKIIPPAGWRPTCALDTEKFQFRTRKQALNSMEARCRANLNYVEQLFNYHAQHGHPLKSLPMLDGRPLDLYELRQTVEKLGGYGSVADAEKKKGGPVGGKWAEVGKSFGLEANPTLCLSHAPTFKAAYERYILPYERFVQKQKTAQLPSNGPLGELNRTSPAPSINGAADDSRSRSAHSTPRQEIEKRGTRSQSKLKRRAEALAARDSPLKKKVATEADKWEPGDNCEVCGRDDDERQMLLCDGCEEGYHIYCLDPPLNSVPKIDWYCTKCLLGRGDFGFEDGGVYGLAEFQQKANQWKRQYFEKQQQLNPAQRISAESEEDVEREFWRLVQDVNDDTQVEYGADIHVTTSGSAFPTLEKQPLDRYAADPWNLNNIALLDDSLLRFIKSNVSGMIVPWLYVGMCFSTFCWHNEDHYTYSVNYQHFGEAKTWYGIPADDASKFEDVMRKAVPELFEQQPDLLLQLVTIFSPQRLVDEGVKVYGCNQHANEFVITFPQAYHAGFNQGFNFNEAVNFATPDWVAEGYAKGCVERYRQFSRQPVFSHDELLLTAIKHETSIRAAMWLGPALTEMYEREMLIRKTIRQEHPNLVEVIIDQDMPEEGYTCGHCKSFSYLSQVACKCTTKVTCPEHEQHLCECADERRHLRLRYSDTDLLKMERRVNDRARQPDLWREKLQTTLQEGPRPPIKALRTLVAEGEKIPYPIAEVETLRHFVNRANEWIDEANAFISKRSINVGRRKSEKMKAMLANGDVDDTPVQSEPALKRQPEYVLKLLEDVEKLAFRSPEVQALHDKAAAIQAWRAEARSLMKLPQIAVERCMQLIESGQELNVDIPEIRQFITYVSQLNWLDRARPSFDKLITLDEVSKLFKDGQACGVPLTSLEMHELCVRKEEGEQWEEAAQKLLAADKVALGSVSNLLEQIPAKKICANDSTVAKLVGLLDKGNIIQRDIANILLRIQNSEYAQRPTFQEARDLITKVEGMTVKPADVDKLSTMMSRNIDWLKRAKRIFGKANAPQDVLNQHLDYVIRHNQATFSLDDIYRDPVEPVSRDNSPVRDLQEADARPDVFCICRQSEAGMMLECDICREWYHGKCLKISKKDVNDDDDRYVCPVCDWRQEIPRPSNRPLLEEMQALERDAMQLPFVVAEVEKIHAINATAQTFRERLKPFFSTYISLTSAELSTLKFYLRKLEGGEILLANETNHFRAKVHELYPIAPTAPPVVSESKSTRKPRMSRKRREELIAQGIDPATWKPPEQTQGTVSEAVTEPQTGTTAPLLPTSEGHVVLENEPDEHDTAENLREASAPAQQPDDPAAHEQPDAKPALATDASVDHRLDDDTVTASLDPVDSGVVGGQALIVEPPHGSADTFGNPVYGEQLQFQHDPDIAATLTGLRHFADNPFATADALHSQPGADLDRARFNEPGSNDLLSSALKVGSNELRELSDARAHIQAASGLPSQSPMQGNLDEDGDFDMYLA